MKENAIAKINKAGKIFNVITIILKIVIFVTFIVVLIGIFILFALPDNLFSYKLEGTTEVMIDVSSVGARLPEAKQEEIEKSVRENNAKIIYNGIEMTLEDVAVDDQVIAFGASGETELSIREIRILLVVTLVNVVMTFITLLFLGRLAKAFQNCQTPFEENVIKKMQALAYSLIPWVLVSSGSGVGLQYLFTKQTIFSVELTPLLTMGIILALTYVFKYGAVLQQESDETL